MATIQELFDIGIKLGIKNDPREKKNIDEMLADIKKAYKKMDKKKKELFDTDKLINPFLDSRIFYAGRKGLKIKKILVGVDAETQELLLAKELNREGKKIDAVMAHHPEGRGLLNLPDVMKIQEDVMEDLGITPNIVEKLLSPRIQEVVRGVHATNAFRAPQAAELLDMPFFNIHTPADNCAFAYMEQNICKKKFKKLNQVVEAIIDIPEYKEAARQGNPPKIFVGGDSSKPGKIATTGFTGGTGGSEKMYEQLSRAGIGTVMEMHMSESHRKEAEKHHLNVIICSHMASDSLGLNHVCDEYEKMGLEIVSCSGFIRVKRK